MVTVYDTFRPVAAHGRARRPVRDHLPSAAQAFFAQAHRVGPAGAERIERPLADRIADRIAERLRSVQNVLCLAKSYPAARLEVACVRELAHDSPFYRTVKTIRAGGHDLQAPPADPTASTPHAGHFARDAASLFAAPRTVQSAPPPCSPWPDPTLAGSGQGRA